MMNGLNQPLEMCSKCGTPKQVLVGGTVRNCMCQCEELRYKAKQVEQKKADTRRLKEMCFANQELWKCTFDNDTTKNNVSRKVKRYAEEFDTFVKSGKGLLLWGNVGTGKSYYAACIANYLTDKGRRVLMTNLPYLINKMQESFDGRNEFISSLNNYALLIIDDLGVERNTEYMVEQVFAIIDSRYRSGLPMIITTNLSLEQINGASDIGHQRIYDRIIEKCHPIHVGGASHRKMTFNSEYKIMEDILND